MEEQTDEDGEEEVAEASSALVSDYYIPDDGPTAPPLAISWVTTIGSTAALSTVTYKVKNTGSASRTFTLDQRGFGLDDRTLTRRIGDYTLSGGQELQGAITLSTIPVKSVSHSTQLTIQATLTHNGEPLTLIGPPAFTHYNSAYTQAYVYSYDTMASSHNGGQLITDGYALAGKILVGSVYVDIATQRQTDAGTGVPVPVMGPIYSFASGGGGGTSPEPGGWYTVCGLWRTKFVDANNGDFGTEQGEQEVKSSYAKAEIRRVTTSPCPYLNPDWCSTQVWQGFLNAEGCVAFTPIGATKYQLKMYSELKRTLGSYIWSSVIQYFDSSQVNKGVRVFHKSFISPPNQNSPLPNTAHLKPPYQMTGNVAANISRLFLQTDIPAGPYDVHANIGCGDGNTGNANIPVTDSCAGPTFTNIGPEVVPGSQIPGDMVWKNVIAHELGHQVQRNLNGVPYRTYEFKNGSPCSDPDELDSQCQPDDVTIGSACRCEQVISSNRLHCLQSRETMSAGDAEGFAHFMAARIWNISTQSDCTFNYYKEFSETGGIVKGPPYKVDCKVATKWRDNNCFDGTRGTEYDWLQFFWNLNTVSVNKIPLGDIGLIHTGSCGGNCETLNSGVDWLSLRGAAYSYYGGPLAPKSAYFKDSGQSFGVDEDL